MGSRGCKIEYDYSFGQAMARMKAQRRKMMDQQRRRNAENQRALQEMRAQYQEQQARMEAKRQARLQQERRLAQRDVQPQEFGRAIKSVQDEFIDSLRTYTFSQYIYPKVGTHCCFVGPTSVGKSSLCNALFNLNLPIGLGSSTKEAKEIYRMGNVTYWDAPGINKDFGFYKPHHLGFFHDLDKIFILFSSDVNDVELIIRVFATMNKQMILVRTKCDTYANSHLKTIYEELNNDLYMARLIDARITTVVGVGRGSYEGIVPYL